jgi:hypothetical protein
MLPEIVVTAIPLPLPGEAVPPPGPVNGRPDAEPPPVQSGDAFPKPGDASR